MSLSVPGHSGPLRFVHSSRITHLFNTHPLGRLAEVHAPSSALGRQKHIQGEGRREHQGLLRSYFGAAAWTWGELRTGGLCTCRQKEQVLVLQARGGGMGGGRPCSPAPEGARSSSLRQPVITPWLGPLWKPQQVDPCVLIPSGTRLGARNRTPGCQGFSDPRSPELVRPVAAFFPLCRGHVCPCAVCLGSPGLLL